MTLRKPRLLALAILLAAAITGIGWAPSWVETFQLLQAISGHEPVPADRQTVDYSVAGRSHRGDLYRVVGRPGAGLVIVPGAAELGKDDPRLVHFAAVLAGAGFTVLVPDIESQKALHVGPENVEDVADAIDCLAGSQKRVGVAAISYAVGPAILAGLKEQGKLAFLVAVGGYYDLDAVIGFFTTGWYFEDGHWQKRTPNAYGKWVFVKSNAQRLWDSGDRALLEVMAARRMVDAQAPIADLAQRLTPTAQPVYDLLTNGDPQQVPALIGRLPPPVRDDILALDLKDRDLSRLSADVLLIHGRDDAIVPSGESRKLAQALPHARLFLVDHLAHADWNPGGWSGMMTLFSATRALLEERNRAWE